MKAVILIAIFFAIIQAVKSRGGQLDAVEFDSVDEKLINKL